MNDRRLDWSEVRPTLNLAAVARDLLGPPQPRRGAPNPRRLWWSCPFHDDPNPSFCVEVDGDTFKCFGCGEKGDAATLAMKALNLTFPEAVRHLAGDRFGIAGGRPPLPRKPSPKAPRRPVEPADNLPRAEAERLVDDAVGRLWSSEGRSALDYLTGRRGLAVETIASARLGVVARPLDLPGKPRGLVVPWYVGGELAMVKLRQPRGVKPKYRQVFIDHALHVGIFPDPEAIHPGRPLIVTEGEFDCLLLAQELVDFGVAVVTLGSASARLTPAIRSALLPASAWIVAADADEAGDRFAATWPATARRVRPIAPDKDWTEMHAGGFSRLRYWWGRWLGVQLPLSEFPSTQLETCP